MKAKRVLALILSVAMVMTSGELPVKASTFADTAETVSFVSEGDPDAAVWDVSGEQEGAVDVSGSDETADDVSGSDRANVVDVSGSDKADEATDVSENSAETADVSGNSASESDVSLSDGSARVTAVITAADYFEVDADGTLRYKEGKSKDDLPLACTLTLPVEVQKIPYGIFNNNEKITGLTIPEGSRLIEIEANAFERSSVKSMKIPKTVKKIKEATFKSSSLNAIEFENGSTLDGVDKEAFYGTSITSVTLPNGTVSIGESAFKNCNSMTTANLSYVEKIGTEAFSGCANLKDIAWSTQLKEVGDNAFSGCKIAELTWGEKNSAWLADVTWGSNVFEKCTALKKVVLPAGMKTIPTGMFYGCTALSTLTIPYNSACTRIGKQAFEDCEALASVEIPQSVNVIESKAFAGCKKLATVTIKQRGQNAIGSSDIYIAKDAFPQKAMTMKGYGGTVEDYANEKGYTFTTLFEEHTLTLSKGSNGSVSLNPKKSAKAGTTVEVKVTPNEGYRLEADTFEYNNTEINTLKEADETSQTFTFEMPDEDVTVYVNFEKNNGYGTLKPTFVTEDPYAIKPVWAPNSKETSGTLTFARGGQSTRLVVTGTKYNPGSWLFNYTSDATSVAVIESDGTIYARGAGKATIKATLKSNTDTVVKFTVQVSADPDPESYEFTFKDPDNKAKFTTETINGKEYTVVTYTKGNVAKGEREFTADLSIESANSSGGLKLLTKWKVANTDIAYVDSESVNDNHNKIHVKKGVTGETVVTVAVMNGKSGTKKVEYYTEDIIIRVMDTIPRLKQTKLTVNSQCLSGTEFNIVSVYGHEADLASLRIVQLVKNGTISEYEETTESQYVEVRVKDGKTFLDLTQSGESAVASKDLTYSNMYFEGEYSYVESGEEIVETFQTPIKTLVLTSKALKPTVKVSGQLNLFFSNHAAKADRGEVTFTQSLKDLNVISYELVSVANDEDEDDGAFANNFDVDLNGVITRSDNELRLDAKGKPVTSGYLKITYDGYEPCYVKITVPAQNKKPAYVLSSTKATVNAKGAGYEIKLQLLDKKTKKVVSLETLSADGLSFDESAKGTTDNLFGTLDAEDARESDTITLTVNKAQKGKAVINVELDAWNEPMKFTFNLNVNSKAPTVKAKNSTLTLNNLCVGREASTAMILNQADVKLIGLNDQFVGKAAQTVDANKIEFDYDENDGALHVFATQKIGKGSYKFKLTPTVQYANGKTETLKAINVTVKVIDTKLTAALKPASVTLNNTYYGSETAITSYTIKNLPAGEVELDVDNVKVTGANDAAAAVRSGLDFTFDGDDTKISVTQTNSIKAGNYKYKVSGLKVKVGDSDATKIEDFNITVKIINKVAKLGVKAKGSIIIGNDSSNIVYTLQPKNMNLCVTDESMIVIKELDTTNDKNNSYVTPEHFIDAGYIRNDSGIITGVVIKADPDATLDAKTAYKLRIGIILPGMIESQAVMSGDLTIKAKQVLPKIKTDITETTMYTSVPADSEDRCQDVLVTKTTEDSAEIVDVILNDKNSDNIKKAFEVTYDPDTQIATVKLVNPAWVNANTTYTIKLEAKVKGQMKDTTGPVATLKVKILN